MPDETPLSLSREEMRELGYRMVDMLVDHYDRVSEEPVVRTADRATLEQRLREPLPEEGKSPLEVLARVREEVFRDIGHLIHPRFFAFIPSPGNFVGVVADALASGFNVFAGSWLVASGPAQVELVTVDWLRELCGLPPGAGGLFTSGGSAANLIALAAARHARLGDDARGAVVYCSDQTHSSVDRALRLLGFAPDQLRKLTVDADLRLDLAALESAVAEDRRAGKRPFCVVATAGTTNTGAVDPLDRIAAITRREGLWLHVDGAYGASAVFSPRGRELLPGLGEADSLSMDPHKWLFQPIEIGCVLARDVGDLRRAFHVLPEYLKDAHGAEEEVNFRDLGFQLTRGFRALKLWMSIQTFGRGAFAAAIERGMELAEFAERAVRDLPEWEVTTPARMGIVTFRCVPTGAAPAEVDALNAALVGAMVRDGLAFLTSTRLGGRPVLRLCPINPRTTESDVLATLHRLDELRRAI